MNGASLDIAHMLAGGMVLVSFMLLYQDRMFALLNVFALHAVVLSLSVAWQAHIQNAPHLYVPAAIALVLKGIFIPLALRQVVIRLGIHRIHRDGRRHRPDHALRHRARCALDGCHVQGSSDGRSASPRGSRICPNRLAAWAS